MTEGLSDAYNHIGAELSAKVAPAGLAWAKAVRERPDIVLYRADNSHPSGHGTYLAACVLYSTLTGREPKGLYSGGLANVTRENAEFLQKIAWETVVDEEKRKRR